MERGISMKANENYRELVNRVEEEYAHMLDGWNENVDTIEQKAEQLLICKVFKNVIVEEMQECSTDNQSLLYYQEPLHEFYEYYVQSNGNLANGLMVTMDDFVVQARNIFAQK